MKDSPASQSAGGSPEEGGLLRLSSSSCRSHLWLTATETIRPIELGPRARRFLQSWITMGVERMQMTDCLSPSYFAVAQDNLKTFVHLMKTEALMQGHAQKINMETVHAAHRQLERKGFLTTFALWPFWPDECVPPRHTAA
jgi:hypothetical protein